jgi:hypothetical protein
LVAPLAVPGEHLTRSPLGVILMTLAVAAPIMLIIGMAIGFLVARFF